MRARKFPGELVLSVLVASSRIALATIFLFRARSFLCLLCCLRFCCLGGRRARFATSDAALGMLVQCDGIPSMPPLRPDGSVARPGRDLARPPRDRVLACLLSRRAVLAHGAVERPRLSRETIDSNSATVASSHGCVVSNSRRTERFAGVGIDDQHSLDGLVGQLFHHLHDGVAPGPRPPPCARPSGRRADKRRRRRVWRGSSAVQSRRS